MPQLPILDYLDDFPPLDSALTDPNGLLAIGGDLSSARLLSAYRHGIFPWFSEDEPVLWWSPDPRAVIWPDNFHISKRLRRRLNSLDYQVTINQAFGQVVSECAAPRATQDGTWILPEMAEAYQELHRLGSAHSLEVWQQDQLVGGIYGISLGKFFFGESMFSRITDGSKIAMAYLMRLMQHSGLELLDCQVPNPHLTSLGATTLPRADFAALLADGVDWQQPRDLWLSRKLEGRNSHC